MFNDFEIEDILSLFDDDDFMDYDEFRIDDIFGMSYEDFIEDCINELEMKKWR